MAKIKKRLVYVLFSNIPVDIRNRFKAICAEKGVTMRSEFVRFMEHEIAKANKKNA